MTQIKIEELGLRPELQRAIGELEYTELTPIQEKCIPEIRQGKDVVGQSSTGSGKTVAFGLPIIEKIVHGNGVQTLVLTPTRELCVQVTDALNHLGKYMHIKAASVYGGAGIEPQIQAIKKADIVVGTPGRIIDHIRRRTISFVNVKILVLDEADRMLDMGFIRDVEFIIGNVPRHRQTLLFSATIPQEVHRVIERYLKSPVFMKTEIHVAKHLLRQVYYEVQPEEKFSLLVHLLKERPDGMSIIFCSTRREADVVGRNLLKQGIRCMTIHGGIAQNKRLASIDALKSSRINALVATDVAARGLDIRNVTHIYNYDVPKTSEEYVHRVGRTARAGMEGDAVTLLTRNDHDNFRSVLRNRSLEIEKAEKPKFEIVRFVREGRFGRDDGYDRRQHGGGRPRGMFHRKSSGRFPGGSRFSRRRR
ncbi:MAG: DEAD/DEAH box helicase [Candidatus Aenigmarchaeota archaeon]|nr:DEAD/DEAH box helicase [Candidatus Aenigmarchaeota archaeon]